MLTGGGGGDLGNLVGLVTSVNLSDLIDSLPRKEKQNKLLINLIDTDTEHSEHLTSHSSKPVVTVL